MQIGEEIVPCQRLGTVDDGTPVKLCCVILEKNGFTLAEHDKRWREEHAPLVARLAPKLGMKRSASDAAAVK